MVAASSVLGGSTSDVARRAGLHVSQRALNAGMDHHLAGEEAGNSRNGYSRKTVTTETDRIELAILRDRQATFDPQLIARYQRRFPGFDDMLGDGERASDRGRLPCNAEGCSGA